VQEGRRLPADGGEPEVLGLASAGDAGGGELPRAAVPAGDGGGPRPAAARRRGRAVALPAARRGRGPLRARRPGAALALRVGIPARPPGSLRRGRHPGPGRPRGVARLSGGPPAVTRLRVAQVITRCVRGGAYQVVRCLLDRLPREENEQTLISGPEGAPPGARVVPELVREISPWRDSAALARLAGIFAKERPDVIHAHTYKAGVLACVAGRLAGVPAILFTPHGHIFARGAAIPGVPAGAKLEVLRAITRLAQGCADRVTALSEPDLDQQLALRLSPASKYVVVPNGIDVERFAGPRPRPAEGGPIIGAVGRFSVEKGHRHLLEA